MCEFVFKASKKKKFFWRICENLEKDCMRNIRESRHNYNLMYATPIALPQFISLAQNTRII